MLRSAKEFKAGRCSQMLLQTPNPHGLADGFRTILLNHLYRVAVPLDIDFLIDEFEDGSLPWW